MRVGVAAAVVDGALVRGDVEVADGTVQRVGLEHGGSGLAIPGLVDLQVNGYAGVDVAGADADGLAELGRALARDGVLWYQPTLVSAPFGDLHRALSTIGAGLERSDGARVLGAHLEGPFLAPTRAGAHDPEHLRRPDRDALASLLLSGCPVTTVTLAPELDGADELIDALVERGILVSVGHTDAIAAQAHAAFDLGARAVTHLYNAMRPFGHRDPGTVGAALGRTDVTPMLIADGVHVAPDALLVAWRAARGRVALVSDAIAAAGRHDGTWTLGGRDVRVEGGVARLEDGTLAGATRPLAWGLRMLVELGVPLVEAVAAVTTTPARLVGRPDAGTLTVGGVADLVVLDDAFAVRSTLLGGLPLV